MFFPEDTVAAVAEDQLAPSAELVAAVLRDADKVSFEDLR